ncbi:MAG: DUF6263 family protein [Pirellulales bacterium]
MRRFSMASVRGLGWLAVALAAVSVSHGQTQLKMKFVEGETLRYIQDMENKMDMGALGKMDQSMGMEMTMHVDSVDEEGVAQVTQSITRIKMAMVLPPPVDQDVSFDTDEPGELEVENPVLKQMASALTPMIGGKMKMKMSPYGELSDFELDEQLTKHFDSLPKQPGGGLNAAKMKEMMAQMTQPLPKKEIEKGETWQRELKTEMPPLGAMQADYEYTYEGTEEDLERIGVTGDLRITPDEKSPFKIEMKDQTLDGYLLFDNVAGRMSKAVIKQKFKMEINVGQAITIDADSVVTIRLADEKDEEASDDSENEKPQPAKKESPGKAKKTPAEPKSSP